ncbi:tumor necrosis factor ligand superfamily member 10 [Discoglossus pictus]
MMTATGSNPLALCGLVLLISLLLQSVFVAVTYIYFTNEHKQLREAYTRSNIACLTGENLGDFFQTKDFDVKHDPCWEVKSHLQNLIKKIMFKHFKQEMSASNKEHVSESLPYVNDENQEYREEVVAAHVTANKRMHNIEHNILIRKANGHKINTWKFHKNPSFLSNIEMMHGELVIKKSGYYYVYSQIYFQQKRPVSSEEDVGKQIVQQIYRVTSYPDPILLIKNAKTTCWSKNAANGLHSLYQGAVFMLYEYDRLFVTVSDINMVEWDENGTFFGAFLLA